MTAEILHDSMISKALPIALDVRSMHLTDEQFFRLSRDNRDLRFELTAEGELIIMPPTGSLTGWRNARITHRLTAWAESDGSGITFDSSAGFTLPSGAKRSPDAAWVRLDRWRALSDSEQRAMAPICPDFVIELGSAEDSLAALQKKMVEYIENGAQLGWLLEPAGRQVYVYLPGRPVVQLDDPSEVSGEPILPGFVLKMKDIW